jgi:lipopolysaccharide transport system permease protein
MGRPPAFRARAAPAPFPRDGHTARLATSVFSAWMTGRRGEVPLEPAVDSATEEYPVEPASARPSPTLMGPPTWFGGLEIRELWRYRELAYFLTWRDIKVRYKQTVFGAGWAILQPLLLMVVFVVFIGRVSGVRPAGVPYTLFTYSGLVVWTFFASGLTAASKSLTSNEALVSKVYFPRLVMPFAAALSYALDLLIASVLLLAMMAYYDTHIRAAILLAPAFGLLALVTALALGVWFAALNVRYRDVGILIPFLVQVWLFATPVAYALSVIPPRFRGLAGLNPMTGVVEGFRWATIGTSAPPTATLAISATTAVVLLILGILYFARAEQTFADVI